MHGVATDKRFIFCPHDEALSELPGTWELPELAQNTARTLQRIGKGETLVENAKTIALTEDGCENPRFTSQTEKCENLRSRVRSFY